MDLHFTTNLSKWRRFFSLHAHALTFFFLLLLVVLDRVILLQHFTFLYLDDDQSIFWFGAKEFSEGGFHEPYFFGQPYNPLFESLLAVPLLKAGVSYAVAISGVMSFVTLFPYVLMAALYYRRKRKMQSLLILTIPLLLPLEYGMGTAISRGCAAGVFVACFALLSLFSKIKIRFYLFGFFGMLALYLNLNAVLVLFPAGIWLLLDNYQKKQLYWQTLVGAVLSALIWFASNHFYTLHPEYVVHNSWKLNCALSRIHPNKWNDLLGDVMPVFWHLGILMFPLLLGMVALLWRQRDRRSAYALLAGVLLLLFALTVNKVHDGYPTVFYSWSRMFTALPLLMALFLGRLGMPAISPAKLGLLLLVPVTFFTVKCTMISAAVHHEVVEKTEHNMYVSKIPELKKTCKSIRMAAEKLGASLIIIGRNPEKHQLNYACPCLEDKWPISLEPQLDRRTWVLKAAAVQKHPTILFAGFSEDQLTPAMRPRLQQVSTRPLLFVLRGNVQSTELLLDSLELPMRAH